EKSVTNLDKSHCRVDDWFNGVGKQRFGAMAEFQHTASIHNRFHEASDELIVLHINRQSIEARSRISDLEALSTEFSASLNRLMIAISME
ncbi:hypothetical protein JZU71_01950, partial [bacterium]|nr:hypothetical protein [bacterium]